MDHLVLNGKKFYYEEIGAYSFRNSIPINGYEAKVLEFCRNWFSGQQEFTMHTSGSTGPPKTITLTRAQLEASARRTVTFLGLQKEDRVLLCLNVEAISGMMMLVRGLVSDLHLTVVEPIANPLAFSNPDKPFDFISFVPYQLQAILTETPAKKMVLDFAKAILIGGAPLPPELESKTSSLKAAVYQTYGMTETASHIALRRLNGENPEIFYRTFDDIVLGQDARGCLTIQGDITGNQTIITNDLVELLSPNTFTWLGRVDNTINSGGYKIQLEKVEVLLAKALLQNQLDYQSFITSVADPKLGSRLVAVLEGEPLPKQTEQQLIDNMLQLLNKYEVPKEILYTPKFSRTPTGKIDKITTNQKISKHSKA
jgi:O-succinylbenzoic acid--CoA ligase